MTITLSETQSRAIAAIRDWYETRRHDQQIFRLFGYAGTGKTTITAHAIEALGLEPMTPGGFGGVLFAAFTGKAAFVMTRKTGSAQTSDPANDPATDDATADDPAADADNDPAQADQQD